MYRLLTRGINTEGSLGDDGLIFCDKTRDVEFFYGHEIDFLYQFVQLHSRQMAGLLEIATNEKHTYLRDLLGRQHYGPVGAHEIQILADKGFLISDTVQLERVVNVLYVFRDHIFAIIDTDERLWYLDARGADKVVLSDICKSVVKTSIHAYNHDTLYVFDDKLEYVHPYCFVSSELWSRPNIRTCSKFSNIMTGII